MFVLFSSVLVVAQQGSQWSMHNVLVLVGLYFFLNSSNYYYKIR